MSLMGSRLIHHFWLAGLLIALGGCQSFPDIPDGVSVEGFNLISVNRLGLLTYVKTDMYLPGKNREGRPNGALVLSEFRCTADGLNIKVSMQNPKPDVARYCIAMEGALRQVLSLYKQHPVAIHMYLLPAGAGFKNSKSSFRFSGATLSLAAPLFTDDQRSLGNIVDLVSHEAFHLAGYLSGDSRAADERTAYWMGLCSQLRVLGQIKVENMPGGAIATDNQALAGSSSDASFVRREVWPFISENRIQKGTPGGESMEAACSHRFSKVLRAQGNSAPHNLAFHL